MGADVAPTLHLTNFSCIKLHGPGLVFTIMARPRSWEHGVGRVPALVPGGLTLTLMDPALTERVIGRIGPATDAYRAAWMRDLESALQRGVLAPGAMLWSAEAGQPPTEAVGDGDTLCCACSRAEATAGRCHRAWAAPFLVRAGWRVLLDGAEVESV